VGSAVARSKSKDNPIMSPQKHTRELSQRKVKAGNAQKREQRKRTDPANTVQQGNRANVRQNTTRQGNRRGA
jgi:hypothetical protein